MGGVVRGGEESISGDDEDGRASQLVVQYTTISKSRKVREQQVRVNGGKWEMGKRVSVQTKESNDYSHCPYPCPNRLR